MSEKRRFRRFFLPKSAQKKPGGFSPFLHISGGLEGLFDFYNFLHHHPCSQHTKQFWSRPHGL
jgi:hypothetical protein